MNEDKLMGLGTRFEGPRLASVDDHVTLLEN